MIVKTLSRKSGMNQLLRYVLSPDKSVGKDNRMVLVRRNIRGKTLKAYEKEFTAHQKLRVHKRVDMNVGYHTILSLHTSDTSKVTDQMLRDLSSKYMALKGSGNLYLAVAHFNTQTVHVHIIESGNDFKGKANSIRKNQFEKLKNDLENYQQKRFPELTQSLPITQPNEKKQQSENYKNRRTLEIERVTQLLGQLYPTCHSVKEFIEKIEEKYPVYYRNGFPQGILCDRKIRFSTCGITKENLKHLQDIEDKETQLISEFRTIANRNLKTQEKELGEQDYEREISPSIEGNDLEDELSNSTTEIEPDTETESDEDENSIESDNENDANNDEGENEEDEDDGDE